MLAARTSELSEMKTRSLDVGGVGRLCGFMPSKPYHLSVDLNHGAPRKPTTGPLSISAFVWRCPRSLPATIHLVLTGGRLPQVGPSLIARVAICMIDQLLRPFLGHHHPDDTSREIKHVINTDTPMTIRFHAAGTSSGDPAASVLVARLPCQAPCFSLVFEKLIKALKCDVISVSMRHISMNNGVAAVVQGVVSHV